MSAHDPTVLPPGLPVPSRRLCDKAPPGHASCAFRDHHTELARVGADVVGLSTQDTAYQREAVERRNLPFALVSDAQLRLTRAMQLPTFEIAGHVLLKRFTLVIRDGRVEHVSYPVFPPDRHAEEVKRWLEAHPVSEQRAGR